MLVRAKEISPEKTLYHYSGNIMLLSDNEWRFLKEGDAVVDNNGYGMYYCVNYCPHCNRLYLDRARIYSDVCNDCSQSLKYNKGKDETNLEEALDALLWLKEEYPHLTTDFGLKRIIGAVAVELALKTNPEKITEKLTKERER